jgi:penicillin-insensitive murein DD-endopeptidase
MHRLVWLAILIVSARPASAQEDLTPAAWAKVAGPKAGPPHAIGGYSSGCIEGAVALPLTGDGFRVARPERHRVFGHPLLIDLLRGLGGQVKKLGLGLLSIGDLGQARGGPAPTGHASHQTGLDVDIWFLPPVAGKALSMIDATRTKTSPYFGPKVARLLALAAADPHVDRIFVHPVLKRALCEGTKGPWLQKIRPWWGHDDHFHVRLACPPDSPDCVAQPSLPAGDGCGELAWWFDAKAQADREKAHQGYSSKVGAAAPSLPEKCRGLVTLP